MDFFDLLPYISSIITGLVSYFCACRNAQKELRLAKLEWEHQQSLRSDQAFSQMVTLVNAQFDDLCVNPEAVTAVMVERSKASGAYALALDDLISAVQSTQFIRIPAALRKVVEARPEWLAKNR